MNLAKRSNTAIFASCLLVACGGNDGGSNSSSTNSNTFVAPNTSVPEAPVSHEIIDERIASTSSCSAQSEFAQNFLKLINETRAQGAVCKKTIRQNNQDVTVEETMPAAGSLSWDEQLCQAALGHSKDMAAQNYFSHTGKDGRNPGNRIEDAGYSWRLWSENIAAGQRTSEAAHKAWMNSTAGHCQNVMNIDTEEVGVAFAIPLDDSSGRSIYWTQKFANPL